MTEIVDTKRELGELFELELFGDGIERRYRKMRPEIEQMPWGTLDPRDYPEHLVIAARRSWTGAAFQEHRTGVASAATLRALFEARAPVDLIALATRFPLDEIVHVELCARLAMELGGGTEVRYEPDDVISDPPEDLSPLMRASTLVVQNFCVGEALSIPMLRGGGASRVVCVALAEWSADVAALEETSAENVAGAPVAMPRSVSTRCAGAERRATIRATRSQSTSVV